MPTTRAKVFWSGRSQAVRLPKEFRFASSEVTIRREGKTVVLEATDEWPEGYLGGAERLPADFARPAQGRPEKRTKLK